MRTALRIRWGPGFLLGVATTAAVVAAWIGLSRPPAAWAQVPDSGAQRMEMIKELREGNRKLMEIAGLLREIRDDARKVHAASQLPASGPQRP